MAANPGARKCPRPGEALAPVELAIADRFGDIRRLDLIVTRQIGDRARYAQNAMIGPRRQSEPIDRPLDQACPVRRRPAMGIDLSGREFSVVATASRIGALPCTTNALLHQKRAFGRGLGCHQHLFSDRRHI